MSQDLGNRTEDSTIGFTWDTNAGAGGSIDRGTPSGLSGTLYVEKIGALTSSSSTAATVTKANPGVVTDIGHGLVNGDEVFFYNMTEMTELNYTIHTVANRTDDTFEIVDTSSYAAAETTGGAWVQVCTTGLTDTETYKDVTGQHRCVIDLSAHAYYTTASDFEVHILGAMIDGQTVNYTLRYFSIENRVVSNDITSISGSSAAADNLETSCLAYSTTRGLAGTALPAAAADAAGGLPISDTGGLDMDALNAAAVRLTAARAQVLDDWVNAGRLDLLLDAIKVVTDAITTNGSGLSAIPWSSAWDAEVQSECADALFAFLGAAGVNLTALGGMSTGMKAEINIECDTAVADAALATAASLTTVDTVVDGIQTDLSNATDGLGALKALIDALNNFNPASDTVKLGDVAHGGSAATLALKSVAVANADGNAVDIQSTGSNGKGINVVGDGTGEGLLVSGGTSAAAALFAKCIGSGTGILGQSGGDGFGIVGIGNGSGDGIKGIGGATGNGIKGLGGATGNGIEGKGGMTSGNGIQGTGQGGEDIGGAGILNLFAKALGTMLTAIVQASPAPTTTECDTDLTLVNADQLVGRVILFLDNNNKYVQSVIRASTTAGLLTYDAIPVAPASGDTLVIV